MKKFNVRCQSGQAYQGMTTEQLQSLAASGLIGLSDEINPDGTDRWVPASKVKGLFPEEGESASSAPSNTNAVPQSEDPEDDLESSMEHELSEEDDIEEDLEEATGPSGVALKFIGYAYITLAAADFILYNMDIWDFYAGMGVAGTWIESLTVIIAAGVGACLIAAGTKEVNLPEKPQWVLFSVASIFLLIILVTSADSAASSHLSTVRDGSLYVCPERTLGELAEATMANPSWEAILADDGNYYVNLTGGITRNGIPVSSLIQFKIVGDEFEFYAMEINGEPQGDLMALQVIELLCSQ